MAVITAGCVTGTPSEVAALQADGADIGYVTINAIPWGVVYIDKRKIGDTPVIKQKLSADSEHDLEIRNPNFAIYKKKFIVRSRKVSIFSIKLQPE